MILSRLLLPEYPHYQIKEQMQGKKKPAAQPPSAMSMCIDETLPSIKKHPVIHVSWGRENKEENLFGKELGMFQDMHIYACFCQ